MSRTVGGSVMTATMRNPGATDAFTAGVLGTASPATEFDILAGVWNARVTSHGPMAKMPSLLAVDAIVRALTLTDLARQAVPRCSGRPVGALGPPSAISHC